MRALLVFHGHGAGPVARWLMPGFRHCFTVLNDGCYWIAIDGRAGAPDVRVVAGADFDLAAFYRRCGFAVAEVEAQQVPPRQPLMLGSCVGVAKRLIGLRAPLVVTPLQLWRRVNGNRRWRNGGALRITEKERQRHDDPTAWS